MHFIISLPMKLTEPHSCMHNYLPFVKGWTCLHRSLFIVHLERMHLLLLHIPFCMTESPVQIIIFFNLFWLVRLCIQIVPSLSRIISSYAYYFILILNASLYMYVEYALRIPNLYILCLSCTCFKCCSHMLFHLFMAFSNEI